MWVPSFSNADRPDILLLIRWFGPLSLSCPLLCMMLGTAFHLKLCQCLALFSAICTLAFKDQLYMLCLSMYILPKNGNTKGKLAQTRAFHIFFRWMECVTCSSWPNIAIPLWHAPSILYFYNCLHFCFVVIFDEWKSAEVLHLVSYVQIVVFLFYLPR